MKNLRFYVLGFTLLIFPTTGFAQLAVVDKAAIAQAVQQVSELKQQYEMLKKQYDELTALKDSMTGSYGFSSLLNELEDEQSRRPLPKTWQEVVAAQADGFYGERLDHYSKLFPQIDTHLFVSSSHGREVKSYTLAKSNTQASFAAAEAVYDQIEKRIQTIEALIRQIDQTPNMKAAMNLNSRIVAETGFVSLDLARLNTMQLSLQAVVQNESNLALENHTEFFSTKH